MKAKKTNTGKTSKFWFSLDNAAKIFPAIISNEFTTVFRVTAVLKQPVRIKPFFKAVSLAEERFPYFRVQLKKGFFWYYLEHTPLHFPVEVFPEKPCRRFSKNELLLRILVSGTRIGIEFSHVLTDGTGAFEFLKTILNLYSSGAEAEVIAGVEFFKPGGTISEEEYEDSYLTYFKEEIPPMLKRPKAFHLPWPLKSEPGLNVTNAFVSVKDMKKLAAGKGVSITDYLVSVYLFILQEIYEDMRYQRHFRKCKYIRVQLPVNLRKIFPSITMRNFSLFVIPEIDLRLGHYSFDEIIKTVYHQIRLETDEKLINKNISRNVGSEKKIYVRSMPLFLKSLILRFKYYSLGANQYSGVVTNLGMAVLSPETGKMVDYFVFTPPPPNKMLKVACGIIGFNDIMAFSFINISKSRRLEDLFLNFLKNQGIEVNFENNIK